MLFQNSEYSTEFLLFYNITIRNIDFRWQCKLFFRPQCHLKQVNISQYDIRFQLESEDIQFESRFIDSTIQQQKSNLGDDRRMERKAEIEVEVEYTTKANINWFLNKNFLILYWIANQKFYNLQNVYQSSSSFSSFHRNDFKSCHMSISVATLKRRVESYFISNVMHTTTNVNSLTSWQTINNWRELKLQNIWRRVKEKWWGFSFWVCHWVW